MYNERKDKLSLLNYLVYGIILIIIIVVVVLIIVKTTSKKSKEKKVELVLYSEEQLEDIDKKISQNFASNMANFKYNVIDYYQYKLGKEKVEMSLSLQDLYNKHFINKLSYNDIECDSSNSKVDITKKGSEYKLTFVLTCGDITSELNTYLGSYDYCTDSDICEKKVAKKETIKENIKDNSDIDIPPEEETTKIPVEEEKNKTETPKSLKYTYYEYQLKPNENIGKYSDWSDWSTSSKEASLTIEIDKKTETETKKDNCTETKKETYISGYNTENYISGYTTKKYKVGTKKVQTGTKQVTVNGKTVIQPIYTEEPIYQTKEVPIYKTKKTPIYSTREVTVDNCQVQVDYYRYRTFKYNNGLNYIIYSTNDNDDTLLNTGYVKTNNTIEI